MKTEGGSGGGEGVDGNSASFKSSGLVSSFQRRRWFVVESAIDKLLSFAATATLSYQINFAFTAFRGSPAF